MVKVATCQYCEEPISADDVRARSGQLHRECELRLVLGSVAHIEHRCGCYVEGSEESDPPHMTRRQAARAAVQLAVVMQSRN